MGTLVDSSVLIASRNDKDALHERAKEALRSAELPLILHEYVVLETATVLMNRAGKQIADTFVHATLENRDFRLLFTSESSFASAAIAFTKNRTKLSFVDAALLDLSSLYPVLTFDEVLARAIKRQKV